jgi:hypothetical protein
MPNTPNTASATPRNIVTLSNIPVPLHNWLRHEKLIRSEEAGHRIPICELVVEALEMYQKAIEAERTGSSRKEVAGVSNQG